MAKLLIRVERQDKLIDEAFEEMERESNLRKIQVKVFKAIYKSKVKGLFNIMRNRLKKFIVLEGSNWFECVEKGDTEHIKLQRDGFEKFIYGNEKDLNSEKQYQQFKNDRTITKVIRNLKGRISKSKSWAIKTALGGGQVIDFFNKNGIVISWSVD